MESIKHTDYYPLSFNKSIILDTIGRGCWIIATSNLSSEKKFRDFNIIHIIKSFAPVKPEPVNLIRVKEQP